MKTNLNGPPKTFVTQDLGQLMSLMLDGVEALEWDRNNGNAVGVFPDDARTQAVLTAYMNKKKVHFAVREVMSTLKDLKALGMNGSRRQERER